ncbi:MarR Transcriptional regulators [Rhabdaerophilaceae bacterium]
MSIRLRPSQALRLWHDVVLDIVRSAEVDLTARQLVVLLTIYLEPPPHTVRGLAQKLGVTKPVITRALDAMGDMDLVSRRRDPADRRNVIIQRTVRGALFVEKLGDLIVDHAAQLSVENPLR